MIFHRLLASGKAVQAFKPRIIFPVNNEELFEFDLIEGNSFSDAGGTGTHRASRWQVSTSEDFSNVAYDTAMDVNNLTTIPVSEFNMDMLSTYYVRVRYVTLIEESRWSEPAQFSTNLFEGPVNDWADDIFNALTFGF